MEIRLLYFDDCPNWRATADMVRDLVAELDLRAEVELVNVATHESAEQLGFRGSPTVLLDGRDPFLDEAAPIGLSCRVYRTDAGLAGRPTESQLRSALLSTSG